MNYLSGEGGQDENQGNRLVQNGVPRSYRLRDGRVIRQEHDLVEDSKIVAPKSPHIQVGDGPGRRIEAWIEGRPLVAVSTDSRPRLVPLQKVLAEVESRRYLLRRFV